MQPDDFEYLYALEEEFWWFAGMREVTAALLDPCCPPGPRRAILDAGCGTGRNLAWLARYAGGDAVHGMDLSTDALRYCRARAHPLLACASVTEMPFPSARFDLVTSFDVVQQLSREDGARAAEELFRVLRPGGVAFVRVAAYEWMRSGHDAALGTRTRYGLGELQRLLASAGLRVCRATYANGVLLPVAAVRRLAMKPLGLADRGSDVKPLAPGLRWLNRSLRAVLESEAAWLRRGHTSLPAGLSAICVARRPASG